MPPHQLPSASSFDFSDNSKIFVVDCDVFDQMEPSVIHKIFKHRHILVNKVESGKRVDFDERGLSMLAPLDKEVYIQCV